MPKQCPPAAAFFLSVAAELREITDACVEMLITGVLLGALFVHFALALSPLGLAFLVFA